MIDRILCWIGSFLGWLDNITGSYMIALFLFALIVEILMLPLGIKQQKNSIKQALLSPKEKAIRKKYAGRDDKVTQQKVAQEIQEMYQKENFNQFGGCLPLLLQFPIIIALYQVVINPLHYVVGISTQAVGAIQSYITTAVDAGGLGMTFSSTRGTIELINLINDKGVEFFSGLAQYVDSGAEAVKNITVGGEAIYGEFVTAAAKGLPNFNFLGINLGGIPTITQPSILWIIPVLTFVVYFFSMKLNRRLTYQASSGNAATDKQTGCSNKVMDITMPLFSVYITFVVPSAIGVYWIFKSMLGTLKQFILSRTMPLPVFTEEDYKAAEREYAGKAPKDKERRLDLNANSGNARSLFHVDDEDYVPPVDSAQADKPEPSGKNGSSDNKESSTDTESRWRAPLKDDSDRPTNGGGGFLGLFGKKKKDDADRAKTESKDAANQQTGNSDNEGKDEDKDKKD